MGGRLYLGTSGFAYDEWKGRFYPETISGPRMLSFYAERFGSVEINYTFRRMPSERALRTWGERTPQGFRFALKAHQRISHTRRLRRARDDLDAFVERAGLLGDRLGPILVQCPPTLPYDSDLISSFLETLSPGVRFAMEFRHPSWEAARPALADRGVAWCLADTDERPADPAAVPAEPFAYLRLRREAYGDEELRAWAEAIRRALDAGRDVHCYLKHEEKATGPRFAARLAELLA